MRILCLGVVFVFGLLLLSVTASSQSWPQWGRTPQHSGFLPVLGQAPNRILVNMVYDPFVPQAQAESFGNLLTHYQVPLVDDRDVFMVFKTGNFVSCDPPGSQAPYPCGADAWDQQIWNVKRLHWKDGKLVTKWIFVSDWKPEPSARHLGGWEPVFHSALGEDFIYVPGAGGTVWKISRGKGKAKARLNPFGSIVNPNTFVAGPLTLDSNGNIYYNVLKLDGPDPWGFGFFPNFTDIPGAWLVKITNADKGKGRLRYQTVSYKDLIPNAPSICSSEFARNERPWPPSPDATTPTFPCGSQRPGVNVAPAIAPDGTIYSVSRAHGSERYGYIVAFTPDLALKWAASLRGHLQDGCNDDAGTFPGSLLPANGTPGGCRTGANPGVDPATNEAPAGRVTDVSSSSPVLAPDGSVLYGAFTAYNGSRGHLFRFGAGGDFAATYDFGWDLTPAIYPHDGTFSIVIKDNHYVGGGPFYISQLSADLALEWQFQSTNTLSCQRNPDDSLTCVSDHPNGFEWCINAPAVDAIGNVYANSEDGNLYVIGQGGTLQGNLFTNLALGAAYTPLALGFDGRIYTQNDGHLFVIGQ
jgi:hypothetical protein